MDIHFTPIYYVLYFLAKISLFSIGSKRVLNLLARRRVSTVITAPVLYACLSLFAACTLNLLNVPSLYFLILCLWLPVLAGLLDLNQLLKWIKNDRSTWVLYSLVVTVFAAIGSRVYGLPSGDDTSVHAYIIDKISRYHHLFSGLNPIAMQDFFGKWSFIYYPSMTHAFLAAFAFELKWAAVDYQPQSMLAISILAVGSSVLFVRLLFKYFGKLNLIADEKLFLIAALITIFRYQFPVHAFEEGGFNRVLMDAVVNLFSLGVLLAPMRSLTLFPLNVLIFPVLIQSHPASACLFSIVSLIEWVNLPKARKFSLVLALSAISAFAFLYFSLKTGEQYNATNQRIALFRPSPSYSFIEFGKQILELLSHAFLTAGEDYLFGVLPYFRSAFFLAGIIYFWKNKGHLRHILIYVSLLCSFLITLLFIATFGLKPLYPLSGFFYHGYTRMSEVLYLVWVILTASGVIQVCVWLRSHFSYLTSVRLLAGFALVFMINAVQINYKSIGVWAGRFVGAQTKDIEGLIYRYRDELNDSQVLILNTTGSRSLIQIHSVFKNEPILQWPECLENVGWTNSSCEARKLVIDRLENILEAKPYPRSKPEMCLAITDLLLDKKVLVLWGMGGTGMYGSQLCNCGEKVK